jgi:hypothetical protein
MAFYEAFQYRPRTDEPLDHVAVEAGFIGYLKMKEAFARARDAADEIEVVAGAARAFLREHLGALAEPLSRRLAETGLRYLALAGQALVRRVPASAGAVLLPPMGTPSGDGALACGLAEPGADDEEMGMESPTR